MATIATLNIGMRVGTQQLAKGLDKARGHLATFKSAVMGAGTAFAGLAGALAAGVSIAALTKLTQDAMGAIDATAKLSDRINTTTESLVGLRHAAELSGASASGLDASMEKLAVNIGKAQGGAKGVQDAFASVGLSADELANMDSSEAFKLIADGINELPTASQKAEAAMAIFGKQGVSLLNTLAAGSDGISAMQKEAEELGMTYSRIDAAQVEAANDAIDRAKKRFQGLGNQLAIQLAPYIEAAAEKFTEFSTQWLDWGQIVETTIDWVVTGLGIVADVFHTLKLLGQAYFTLQVNLFSMVVEAITSIGEGLEYLVNLIPGVEVSFSKGMRNMTNSLHEYAKTQREQLWAGFLEEPPSTGIKNFFDEIKTGAREAAEEITSTSKSVESMGETFMELTTSINDLKSSLQEQITTFGMSSREMAVYKLRQEGASTEMLREVIALSKQLDGMEEAQKVFEATATPLEKYEAEIEKLAGLYKGGFIDPETFRRAIEQAESMLPDSQIQAQAPEVAAAMGPLQFADRMELGSTEARNAILTHRGAAGADPMNQVEKNTKDALEEEKQHTELLRQILAKTGTEEIISLN